MTERTTNGSTLAAWGLAVLFGLTAAWVAERNFAVRTENTRLADQKAILDVALKSAETQLEAERVVSSQLARQLRALPPGPAPSASRLIALAPSAAGAASPLGLVSWSQDRQEGLLAAINLPPTKDAQRYQLWIRAGIPVRVAAFAVDADGRATLAFKPATPVNAADGFYLTRTSQDPAAAPTEGELILTGR